MPDPGADGPGPAGDPPPDSAIDRLLASERATFVRVVPADLASELAAGALLIDLRPAGDRAAEGELAGATVVDRLVLEWRLDPTSPHRLAALERPTVADAHLDQLTLDDDERSRRVAVVVQLDALPGRPAEEPHLVAVGGHEPDRGPDDRVVLDLAAPQR